METNCAMANLVKKLLGELMELEIVYGYMIQNAPTEEARRITEMNLRTVRMTKELLEEMYRAITGEMFTPIGEAIEVVPVFATFMEAARYAFIEETQVIRGLKELYLTADECHRDHLFSQMVEHQLNAMRLLYLDL